MFDWIDTEKGKKFIEAVFKAVGMPEVKETGLEIGTYTNRQIAEKVDSPEKLMKLLTNLLMLGDNSASKKRSILSFAVDISYVNKE